MHGYIKYINIPKTETESFIYSNSVNPISEPNRIDDDKIGLIINSRESGLWALHMQSRFVVFVEWILV